MSITMTNVYTSDEVARHNKKNDLWMVIHGSVYDISKFLKEHPGGEEVLLDLAGRDGTVCFDEIGHSTEAVLLRETFKIGEILNGDNEIASSSVSNQVKNEATVQDDDWEYQEIKQEKSKTLPIFITVGIVIYAIIFYYLFF